MVLLYELSVLKLSALVTKESQELRLKQTYTMLPCSNFSMTLTNSSVNLSTVSMTQTEIINMRSKSGWMRNSSDSV